MAEHDVRLIYNGKHYSLPSVEGIGVVYIEKKGNYSSCINNVNPKVSIIQKTVDGKPYTTINGIHIEELIEKLEKEKSAKAGNEGEKHT